MSNWSMFDGRKSNGCMSIRFWEVDASRGLAVIMMVVYHFIFDLDYFGFYDFEVDSGFWYYFARITASLFILLVGISLILSHSRAKRLGRAEQYPFQLMRRGIWILSLGFAITAFTYVFIGRGFIVFGVLHLIGVSILLAYPFLQLGWKNAVLGSSFISIGLCLQYFSFESPWLIWLGLAPQGFFSLDYFPIFPWLGMVMLGMAIGDHFYPGYRRRILLPDLSMSALVRPLALLGKNSLRVYLIHQPILIALMYLCGIPLAWI